ncbi:hypothetical protein BH20VER3_BH20VER3_22550 [soil metagenome]
MKSFSLIAVSLLWGVSILAASPIDPEGPAKITKNEAEHIALRQHQGARVTAARLEKVEGVLVWSIDVGQRDGKEITRVSVDAKSGRILPGKGAR